MATYSQAVDQVIAELGKADTSITDVVKQELQNAIAYYETDRFWFNEGRTSFSATSTIYYPIATVIPDLLEIDTMAITTGGCVYEIEPENLKTILEMDTASETGIPHKYAIHAEKIRLYAKPDAVYQVDVDYLKRLSTLSATSDTNAWVSFGGEMIQARAQKQLCAKRYRDYDKAVACKQVEDEAYQKLKDRTERLLGSGKISGSW